MKQKKIYIFRINGVEKRFLCTYLFNWAGPDIRRRDNIQQDIDYCRVSGCMVSGSTTGYPVTGHPTGLSGEGGSIIKKLSFLILEF